MIQVHIYFKLLTILLGSPRNHIYAEGIHSTCINLCVISKEQNIEQTFTHGVGSDRECTDLHQKLFSIIKTILWTVLAIAIKRLHSGSPHTQFVLKGSDFLITFQDRHDKCPLETQTSLCISAVTYIRVTRNSQ